MSKINKADILKHYNWLNHNSVSEVRIISPDTKNVKSKFIKNANELIKLCEENSGRNHIFIGINEREKKGTKIEDIKQIKNFVIDIDNKKDFFKTQETALKIKNDAIKQGFKEPLLIVSGNGFHLYFALKPIENNEKNRAKLKSIGNKIKQKYEDKNCEIDKAVFEPARVMRLAGTKNVKKNVNQMCSIINKDNKREPDELFTKKLLGTKPESSAIIKIGELEPSLSEVINNHADIKRLFQGNWKDKFPSRSEAEESLICKLIQIGLDKKQIFKVMVSCEIGKWQEANIQYRELSYKKALKIINKERETKKNPFKKLHYATKHLPYYHEFSSLIGLYGRHYTPVLKARWYQLVGGILQKQIRYGKARLDTRMHIAYPIVTEGGKNELIYGIKALIESGIEKNKETNFTISEPISYSPESLIGKYVEKLVDNPDPTKKRKIKMKIENRGHFDNDFLEFDECNKLITGNSPEEQQAREYLSKSENPIGKNKVQKRLVDDTKDETIGYFPNCTNSYYFQPFGKIPESAMLQGFLRRKLIPVGSVASFLNPAEEKLYDYKLEEPDFSEEEYRENLIEYLELMRTKLMNVDFIFDEKAKQLIKDYALYISAQGQIHSEKIANYTKLTKFTLLENLIKMSCIISASFCSNIINENVVSLAFMDLVELMQNTYDFVFERVEGEFDYGVGWKGARFREKECLKYLYDRGALSLENSQVSIYKFLKEAVAPIFKVKIRQARNRYLDMKKSGLIDSKQIGKKDSKVWIKFNPSMHKSLIEGGKGGKGYIVYNMVFEGLNTLLKELHSLQPLQPKYEIKTEKVGEKFK